MYSFKIYHLLLLRSASSNFMTKARYGIGEKLAERMDTAGLFKFLHKFMINQKIEHSRARVVMITIEIQRIKSGF